MGDCGILGTGGSWWAGGGSDVWKTLIHVLHVFHPVHYTVCIPWTVGAPGTWRQGLILCLDQHATEQEHMYRAATTHEVIVL